MKRFTYAVALLSLVQQARADLICYETPSQSLYVQLDDAGNHVFAMAAPGSGAHTDRYATLNAAMVTGGFTTAGNYTGIVRIGNAGSPSPSDVRVAVISFGWSGSAVVPPATDSGIPGKLSSWLLATLSASGVFTPPALANAPSGTGGTIGREAADLIAAHIISNRGDFYPNRSQVWVLKRTNTGLSVVDSKFITKPAGETLVVWIDFAGILGKNEAIESIDSLVITGGTADIVADSEDITGNLVQCTVEGGTSGDTSTVDVTVTTTKDQHIVVSGLATLKISP